MAVVTQIDPTDFSLQFYETQDENLISTFDIDTSLTGSSYIEFYVYDVNQNLLYSTTNYTSYTVENDGQSAGNNNSISSFTISPEDDTESNGFSQGEYITYYNFLTRQIGDPNTNLFISEISSDRTEIRLDSNILSNLDIVEQTNNFIQFRDDSNYFVDFYLNFGSNDLIIANNIKLENETTDDPTVVVKLYEPLPPQFELKNELWIVTTFNEPEAFNVTYPPEPVVFVDSTQIQGPNFNVPIKDQINNSTQNLSYNDLITGAPTSSLDQLMSLMDSSSISISVDYTDFNDFIHFSSAKTRLENFYYKASLIEGYSASISDLDGVTNSATSVVLLQSKISDITKNFDRFEYFLYYDSGSAYSWPKTTTEPPYLLAKTGSATVLNWFGSDNENSVYFGGRILSASDYDNANPDELKKAIPEYLREDATNQPYDLFVDMVAQYYDNVWLYTKDITQKYNADNRLDFGVSKDLVADAIRDFGVKLYQNNFSKDDLYTAFLGLTPSGSLFPFPEITSSLPAPTGFEYVDTLISASNDVIPLDDVNKSLYKRIYHNIPYLLKSKGTIAGLRALITSYGIPDTILKIAEFGGKDKVNENDWDYYFNKFNYAFNTQGDTSVCTDWVVDSNWNASNNRPSCLEFRFKAESILPTNLSQSLLSLKSNTNTNPESELTLQYTGSGLTSGSYSGSIKDPYYQYANLIFYPSASDQTVSASIYLPFFDEGWWSVMINSGSNGFEMYAANKIYNGADGTSIGYIDSSSITSTYDGWANATSAFLGTSSLFSNFSGSYQEVRYYKNALSESVFRDYTMNPLSIEGNSINSSPNELIFRGSLGSELDKEPDGFFFGLPYFNTIHPKVTGSWTTTSSFAGANPDIYFFCTSSTIKLPSFIPNTEYYFLDQFPAGIKNRITDKIRYEDNVVPTGDTLSAFRRVTQNTEASASYTENINLLEVAFSPQNEINDDIISQLGYFNIGDYIGDPRQRSSSLEYYPDLNNLSEEYFEKYIKNYDLVDFVRLIKFFDNSLFKMIKDFVPARTSLASGIVIKQHLLERNKYPQPQVTHSNEYLTGSIDVGDIEGGPGGMMNLYNYPPPFSTSFNITVDGKCNIQIISKTKGTLQTLALIAGTTSSNEFSLNDLEDIYFIVTPPLFVPITRTISISTVVKETISSKVNSNPNYLFSITSGATNIALAGTNPFINKTPTVYGEKTKWDEINGYFSYWIQAWSETNSSLSGSVTKVNDSQAEFYNGEFSGSTMLITNGELNSECDEFKNVSTTGATYSVRMYSGSEYIFGSFVDTSNYPLDGYISLWYQKDSASDPLPPPNPSE